MKRFPLPRRRAVSLVEIVLAIGIFSLAVLPIFGVFGKSSLTTQSNQDELSALHICASTLKGLMNLPSREVPTLSPVPLDQTFGKPGNTLHVPSKTVVNGTEFTSKLWVTFVADKVGGSELSLTAKTAAGTDQAMSVYRQFRRYDFRVEWQNRRDGKISEVKMTCYKADLQ